MENQIRGMILGQALALEQDFIVAGTREYITATFQFSPEWDGLSIWAHFDRGNSHWKIHLHEGEILRSDKLNLTHGPWEVSLHGTSGDGMRITTAPVDLKVRRTNIDDDAPLGGAPASPLEQLDQRVTKLEQSGGSGGGTLDHSLLTNREQSDQHPMEAITGLAELRDKINAFLDADDSTLDQLTELIAAIKANQGTIEGLTNGKVNVSDIVNDLTTGGAGKVLSAEMGVELKRLIDSIEPPDLAAQVEAAQTAARESAGSAQAAAGSASQAETHAYNAFAEAKTAQDRASAAAGSAQTAKSEADRAKEEADRAAAAVAKPGPAGKSVIYGALTDPTAASDSRATIADLIAKRTRITVPVSNAAKFRAGDIVLLKGQYNDAPRVDYLLFADVHEIVKNDLRVYPFAVVEDGAPGKDLTRTPIKHMVETTATLDPDTEYIWGEVASLTLDFAPVPADGFSHDFIWQFASGEVPTTLNLPESIKWAGGAAPKIESGKTYQMMLHNGGAYYVEF